MLTVGTGKVTLAGAAALDTLNLIGTDNTFKTLTLNDSSSAKVTLPAAYVNANASARTTAIQVTGNKLDNTISGGNGADTLAGGAGNDSINGGAGNDSLWGQAGADTFIYNSGDGKDMIFGFDNDDLLQITGNWTAAYYSGSGRVVFKVDSTYSAIILEKPTAASFNVNGDTYAISNNKFTKQ